MKTTPVLASAISALTLALAPSAFAQDFCVANPACVSNGGTDKATVEAALTAAGGTAAADRVLIGPGTFVAPTTAGYDAALYPVEIIGAGAGATTLTAPADTPSVLDLSDAGSRVSDLSLTIPASATNLTKSALRANAATAQRLHVTAAPGAGPVIQGVVLTNGAVLQDSIVEVPLAGPNATAVELQSGSSASRNMLSGRHGIQFYGANLHADRNHIYATSTGINVIEDAPGNLATNSVIQLAGDSYGVTASTHNGTNAGIVLRGMTIVGDGTPGSVGVSVGSIKPYAATMLVDSTTIRGVEKALAREATDGTANLTVQYSDLDASNAEDYGPGSLVLGAGNINSDPFFAGPADFHPLGGSPVTDAGNPEDPSAGTDADGNARVTDGDGDGIARRDIGAFELAPVTPASTAAGASTAAPAPTAAPSSLAPAVAPIIADRTAPVITNLRVISKRRLSFRVSEYALLRVVIKQRRPGLSTRRVGTIERAFMPGAGRVAIGRIHGKALRRGRYTATVTAGDAAHNRSAAKTVRFRVV